MPALEPGEMVTEVVIPRAPAAWRCGFLELARRHGDFALAGLAARARVDGDVVAEARLVFFGVGAAPVRAGGAEAALVGRRPDAAAIEAARRTLAAELDPPGDVHGSPALRRHLAGVLLARVVAQLVETHA